VNVFDIDAFVDSVKKTFKALKAENAAFRAARSYVPRKKKHRLEAAGPFGLRRVVLWRWSYTYSKPNKWGHDTNERILEDSILKVFYSYR
jgi:hypothetical protein